MSAFVLATSCTEPDREFSNLMALARAILEARSAAPGRPDPVCVFAQVSRVPLPGGQAVAVRLADGSNHGKGTLVGYAFIPGDDAVGRLQRAIRDLSPARAA